MKPGYPPRLEPTAPSARYPTPNYYVTFRELHSTTVRIPRETSFQKKFDVRSLSVADRTEEKHPGECNVIETRTTYVSESTVLMSFFTSSSAVTVRRTFDFLQCYVRTVGTDSLCVRTVYTQRVPYGCNHWSRQQADQACGLLISVHLKAAVVDQALYSH